MSERWLLIRRRSRQRRQSRLLRRRLQHRNDARPDFSHSPIWCAGSGLEELRMSVWKLSATDRRALNLRATASPLPKLAQSRHDRRRCRCQPSAGGRACTSFAIALIVGIPRLGSGADQAGHGRHVSFVLHLALEIFLGYGREFLPARELIVRNAHIGKPRVRRGVFWPPGAFGSGLFAADATRAAAFGTGFIRHSTNP